MYLVGRIKSTIIIKGHNIEPTDVEPKIWECDALLRTGRAILLPVPNAEVGTEELVILTEIQKVFFFLQDLVIIIIWFHIYPINSIQFDLPLPPPPTLFFFRVLPQKDQK